MSIENIGLTLYDFLGYLFPGYVLVLVCTVVESSFGDSDVLSLASLGTNFVIVTIVAYFLGQISHAVGSVLKSRFYKLFINQKNRLSNPIYCRVQEAAQEAYSIPLCPEQRLDALETYMLADNYLLAFGASSERDILMAREGFHKGSMVAFALLSLALGGSLFVGGARIQTQPGRFIELSQVGTVLVAAGTLACALLFRKRFAFFNRVKINSVLLSFLALYEKSERERKGVEADAGQ